MKVNSSIRLDKKTIFDSFYGLINQYSQKRN